MALLQATSIKPAQGALTGTQPTNNLKTAVPSVQALPALGTVTQNETVQGQMANLMSYNNPLMQRATTRASQAANARGLLNTSMGIQAGQEAALSAALPIAQADAAAYQKQGMANQGYANQFGLADQSFGNTKALSDQTFQQQTGTGVYGTGLIASNVAAQKDLAAQQQAHLSAEGLLDRAQQTTLQDDAQTQQTAVQKAGHTQQSTLQEDNQTNQIQLQNDQQSHTTALETARNNLTSSEGDLDRTHKEVLAALDKDNRAELLEIEASFNSLNQASRSSSNIYSGYLGAVKEIQALPDLTAAQKTAAITSIFNETISSIEVIKSFDKASLKVTEDLASLTRSY
jgi:hypothetical protein